MHAPLSRVRIPPSCHLVAPCVLMALVLLFGMPSSPAAETTQEESAKNTLPSGALARLGPGKLPDDVSIGCLAFSPNGEFLGSGGTDHLVRLWDAARVELRKTFRGHSGEVAAVAFSPDGQFLASAGQDATLRVWDLKTEQCRFLFEGHQGAIHALVFSPEGKVLASASADGTVRLWDMVSGKELRQLSEHRAEVHGLAYSSDGKTLASGGLDGAIRTWDSETGQVLKKLSGAKNCGQILAFCPEGKKLVSCGRDAEDGSVHLWDLAAGIELLTYKGQWDRLASMAVAPDGKTAAAGTGRFVYQWELATGKELRRLEFARNVLSVAFSADGRTLGAAGTGFHVQLWNAATGRFLRQRDLNSYQGIESLRFSPDGTALALGGGDDVRIFDVATRRESIRLTRHRGSGRSVAFSPEGKLLATAGWHAPTALWDPVTGKLCRQLNSGFVDSVCFSPLGALLAIGDHDGRLVLWNVEDGSKEREIDVSWRQHNGSRWSRVVFSPDGKRMATGNCDVTGHGALQLWATATGSLLWKHEQPKKSSQAISDAASGWVRSVAFSPDGQWLVSGQQVGTLRLWDAYTGEELREPWDLGEAVAGVACSPGGEWVAAAGVKKAYLLDIASGKILREFAGHQSQSWLSDVAFSPDGNILATGSGDGTAILWDVAGLKGSAPRVPVREPGAEEWNDLWLALGQKDWVTRKRAIGRLVAGGEKTLAFLKDRLQPMAALSEEKLRPLLAKLDHDHFVVREAGFKEIQGWGASAEPALRKALEGKVSAEVLTAIEKMLAAIEAEAARPLTAAPVGEDARDMGAIRILEQVGSKNAQEFLERLAKGVPAARRTLAAQAALERLQAVSRD